MDRCEVIQVVRTNLSRRGKGVEGDPIRVITQYWSMEGELLWEVDPSTPRADTLSGLKWRVCESEVLRDPKLVGVAREILSDLASI